MDEREVEAGLDDPQSATDRRDVLKKIGVGAAVAWSVPTILSSPAHASASGTPPPVPCPFCGGVNMVANPQAGAGAPDATGWVASFATPRPPFVAVPYGGSPFAPAVPLVPADPPNLFFMPAFPGDPVGGTISTIVDLPVSCQVPGTPVTVAGVANSFGPLPPFPIVSLTFFTGPGGTGAPLPGPSSFVAFTAGPPPVPLLPFGFGPIPLPPLAVSFRIQFLLPPSPAGGLALGFDRISAVLGC